MKTSKKNVCKKCFKNRRAVSLCKVCGCCGSCGHFEATNSMGQPVLCGYCYRCKKRHIITRCKICGSGCRRNCQCKGIPNNVADIPTPTIAPGYVLSSTRAVTVELEYTNFKYLYEHNFKHFNFRSTRDGSVNGSQMEMICGPMHGDGLALGLTEMASAIERYMPDYDSSCGYHVHVDARDMGWFEVATAFKVWVNFGRDIAYKYLWPERASNRFCFSLDFHPLKEAIENRLQTFKTTKQAKELLMMYMWGVQEPKSKDQGLRFGAKVNAVSRDKYGHWGRDMFSMLSSDPRGRYADFNTHSWRYRGTLEFRAHPGTRNPPDLIMWPFTCLSLIENATAINRKGWGALDGRVLEYLKNKGVDI